MPSGSVGKEYASWEQVFEEADYFNNDAPIPNMKSTSTASSFYAMARAQAGQTLDHALRGLGRYGHSQAEWEDFLGLALTPCR